MNHYLLYRLIYGRILEAACAILAMIALVGVGVFRGRAEVWVFWGMAVLFTILRCCVTRRTNTLEDLHLDK